MNVQEYRELKKKKPRKYRNIKIEACPECWYKLKPNIWRDNCNDFRKNWRDCHNCNKTYSPQQFLVFDSRTEWEYGIIFKAHEMRGYIWNLKRQVPFHGYHIDFQYTDNYGVHNIEIKALDKKTGKPYIQGSLADFWERCNAIRLGTGIEVQVLAGGREFRFDEKGKLKEVL